MSSPSSSPSVAYKIGVYCLEKKSLKILLFLKPYLFFVGVRGNNLASNEFNIF